jgi:hypothetical protein
MPAIWALDFHLLPTVHRRLDSLAPAVDPPEEEAEENRAASVHPDGVAKLVGAAGIHRRVDGHIVPDKKIRQRAGHQCAMHHSAGEPGRTGTAVGNVNQHARHAADDHHGHQERDEP